MVGAVGTSKDYNTVICLTMLPLVIAILQPHVSGHFAVMAGPVSPYVREAGSWATLVVLSTPGWYISSAASASCHCG